MKFDRILIMGAGAVGGYFGGRIAERTSRDVTLIARGDHLDAIQRRGLEIQSPEGDTNISLPAYNDPEQAESPDLILFTVKSHDTEQAIEQISPVVTDETQILTIQNGIENYEKLEDAFGEARVIQGFCRIGAGVIRPGVIEHQSFGSIVAGEPDGSDSKRLAGLKNIFDETRISFTISDDIQYEVWVKFAWNCIFNMVTVIAGVTVDRLFRFDPSEKLCHRIFDELREVASAEGIELTEEDRERIIENARSMTGFRTSTYRDRIKGKKLEYEAFTGAVIRLAEKHSLSLPYNQTLYALLQLIDSEN